MMKSLVRAAVDRQLVGLGGSIFLSTGDEGPEAVTTWQLILRLQQDGA